MASNEIGFTLVINGTERVVNNIDEVKMAMGELKQELSQTDLGTEAFDNVRNELFKAGAAFKEFKNDTRPVEVVDQFKSLGSGVAESFSVAEDSLKSFGIESEAVGKVASGASNLITTALRAHEIAELRVDAATAIRAITEKAAAAGTWLATAAQNAFNISLSMNPIGLVVIAIAALAAGIYLLIKPIMNAVNAFDNMSTGAKVLVAVFAPIVVIIYAIKKAMEALGLVDSEETKKARANANARLAALDNETSGYNRKKKAQERAIALAEAEGKSAKEILAMKKKLMADEIATRQRAVTSLMKLGGELTADERKRLKQLKEEIKDFQNDIKIEDAKFKVDQKKTTDDARKKEQEAADEAAQAARDKAKDRAKQRADDLKKQKEDALAIEADALKKTKALEDEAYLASLDDQQFRAKEALRIQQEAARAEIQIAIDKLKSKKKLTKEEEDALAALNGQMTALIKKQGEDTKALDETQAKDRLAAKRLIQDQEVQLIQDKNEKEKELLRIQYERLLEDVQTNEKLNAEEKAKLAATYAEQYANAQKEFDKKLAAESLTKLIEYNKERANSNEYDFATRRQFLLDSQAALLNDESLTAEERLKRAKELSDQLAAIDMAELQHKTDVANAGLALASQVGDALGQIAGENKKLQIAGLVISKAASIGSIIANTALANAKSVAQFPVTAGMPWVAINTASAAISIATTIAATAKAISDINAAGAGGGGGGGGKGNKFATGGLVSGPGTSMSDSIPARLSNGESVINARSTQMYGGLLSAINVAGGGKAFAEGGIATSGPVGTSMSTPIIKTYVVASDMTSQQEADAKIARLAQL